MSRLSAHFGYRVLEIKKINTYVRIRRWNWIGNVPRMDGREPLHDGFKMEVDLKVDHTRKPGEKLLEMRKTTN